MEAEAKAMSIKMQAEATAKGIEYVAMALDKPGAERATALRVAEQYVDAFSQLAKETNSIIIPANANDAASMVAQAMSVYGSMNKAQAGVNSKPDSKSSEKSAVELAEESLPEIPSVRDFPDDEFARNKRPDGSRD